MQNNKEMKSDGIGFSISMKNMAKKEAKLWRALFFPQTRPLHIPTKKRVAWRLVSKWLNRYERKRYIGAYLSMEIAGE